MSMLRWRGIAGSVRMTRVDLREGSHAELKQSFTSWHRLNLVSEYFLKKFWKIQEILIFWFYWFFSSRNTLKPHLTGVTKWNFVSTQNPSPPGGQRESFAHFRPSYDTEALTFAKYMDFSDFSIYVANVNASVVWNSGKRGDDSRWPPGGLACWVETKFHFVTSVKSDDNILNGFLEYFKSQLL